MSESLRAEAMRVAGATAALVALSAGAAACSSAAGQENGGPGTTGTIPGVAECVGADFADVANDPANYDPTAFMPKNNVNSPDSANTYVQGTFKDGPLGTHMDKASLAMINAVITQPAHDGKVTTVDYDYLGAFKANVGAYNTPDGLTQGRKDCAVTDETLTETIGFTDSWVQNGAVVTKFSAHRDDPSRPFEITGASLDTVTTNAPLTGTEVKLRKTSKTVDDFTDVLIATDGNIYIEGVTNGNGNSVQISQGPSGDTPDQNGPNGNTETQNGPSGPNAQNAAGGEGGGPISAGPSPENLPGPTNNGPNGPANNGPSEAGPGQGPTPGGGGGTGTGGGGGETPTTPAQPKPPVTSPPVSSPPVTSPPTTSRPPVTTTPPTQPPIKPPKPGCTPGIDPDCS